MNSNKVMFSVESDKTKVKYEGSAQHLDSFLRILECVHLDLASLRTVESGHVEIPVYTEGKKSSEPVNKVEEDVEVEIDNSHIEKGSFSLAEKLGGEKANDVYKTVNKDEIKEHNTDYHHTGIKYVGDLAKYRLGYKCPVCGESGRHYIPETVKHVSCHKCASPLIVEPVGEKFSINTRDEYGNYLIAEMVDVTKPRA